jgi:hypothetical protein
VGESIIVPIYRKGDIADCRNQRHITFAKYVQNFTSILLSRLTPYSQEIIGRTSENFDETDHIMIICSVFMKKKKKNGNTMKQHISYL